MFEHDLTWHLFYSSSCSTAHNEAIQSSLLWPLFKMNRCTLKTRRVLGEEPRESLSGFSNENTHRPSTSEHNLLICGPEWDVSNIRLQDLESKLHAEAFCVWSCMIVVMNRIMMFVAQLTFLYWATWDSLAIAISVFKHDSDSSMMTVNHFWRGLECSRDEAVLYGAREVGFEALSEKC